MKKDLFEDQSFKLSVHRNDLLFPYIYDDGVEVVVTIDLEKLFDTVGRRAATNKTGKAKQGPISVRRRRVRHAKKCEQSGTQIPADD